jgi:hypothetical protein
LERTVRTKLCIYVFITPDKVPVILLYFKKQKDISVQGRIQDFKLGGGGTLKKIAPSGGRRKHFGVFLVKNHDFTQTNYTFSNFMGGGCASPHLDPPLL